MGYVRRRSKPDDHKLYWIYVYIRNDGYEYANGHNLVQVREHIERFKKLDWEKIEVFYGNDAGPFRHIPPRSVHIR